MLSCSAQLPPALHYRQFFQCLPFTTISPQAVADAVCSSHFPMLCLHNVHAAFITQGPLSWSRWNQQARTLEIFLHEALNHGDTPDLVLRYLVKHELLHFLCGPLSANDLVLRHHDEYRVRERQLAPERLLAWSWLYVNLGVYLKVRPHAERIDVDRAWKTTWHHPRRTLQECIRCRHTYTRPCKRYM